MTKGTRPNRDFENPSVDDVVRMVIKTLRKWKNPARAQGSQKYFKHTVTVLGIDTPTLRSFCKDQVKPLRRTWTLDQAVACCDRLLLEPELEIRGAGFLILGAFKKDFNLDLLVPAVRWLQSRLDNWAVVDGFCGEVLSPLLKKCPEMIKTLRRWSRAESLWVRRAALVALVPFARRGQYLEPSYRFACDHFKDTEDLMHKAVGWLLREAGKTDMERLRRFLLQHGPAVPRTSLRYAIERFPAKDRTELLQRTRHIK